MNTQPRLRIAAPFFSLGLLTVCAVFSSTPAARASLLVYDGFNYPDADSTGPLLNTIDTSTVSSSVPPTGYQGKYGDGNSGVRYNKTGLTFGSLPASGGKIALGNYSATAGAKMASGTTAVSGDLFISYIVNFTGSLTTGSAIGVGVNTSATNTANTAGRYFNVQAVSGDAGSTTAISYGKNASAPTDSAESLVAGTTYMMIAQFTNVGTALSEENPGVATLWVLTSAQYENFLASGFSTSVLNGATIGSGATNVYSRVSASETRGTFSFNNTSTVQYSLAPGTATANLDEVRIGTTLDDVLGVSPIPEPGTWAFLFGSAAMAFACGRRVTARRRR